MHRLIPTFHTEYRGIMHRTVRALVLLAMGVSSATIAQTISGTALNENQIPLQNVTVKIAALHRTATTDESGKFSFGNVPKGEYVVSLTMIGYKSVAMPVTVTSDTLSMYVVLSSSPLELPSVTVTAEPQPSSLLESPLSASVIEGRQLERERGQSVGQTIEYAPGVAAFSGGPLSMKPVIRGLSAQRVLVMAGGVRLESQTWDEPQSPEINVLDVDRIEIVRGPNSVLYGSDALGGVVNIVRSDLQSANEGAPTLRGLFTGNFYTNSPQAAGGISFHGANGDWNYRGNFTARDAGDYSAPSGTTANGTRVEAGKVFNSGGNEIDGNASVGTTQNWGSIVFDATHFGQKYFIAPEPGRKEYELNVNTMTYDSIPAAPSQEILHETGSVYADLPLSIGRLEMTGTYQRNSRKEEGAAESEADEKKKEDLGIKPEAQLVLNTVSFDAKLSHRPAGSFDGTVGISATYQANSTEGQNAIIPDFTSLNAAAFGYEEYRATSALRFTGGVRFDARRLDADANTQLGNAAQTIDYDATTGSVGLSWNAAEPLTLTASAGRGWRAPVAAELFFKGSDEGAVRYKIGDSALTPEVSFNLDCSVRYSTPGLAGEFSLYRNRIDRYIYLLPTGMQVAGLDSYRYTQANATLVGGDLSFQAELARWCVLLGGADKVRGTNDETDSPLPLIPADRVFGGFRFNEESLVGVMNPYATIRVRHMFAQNKLGLFETPTPSYDVVDLGVGGEVTVSAQKFMVDIVVENALDKGYYDHLSRYKEFALDPGRDVELKVSAPFDILR